MMKTGIRIATIACICEFSAALSWAQIAPKLAAPLDGPRTGHTYLGIAVTPIHPVVAANLPALVNPDQGLVVERVIENSPAAKGGIKVPDILLTYDDQKLFSEEQLAKLVHSDRPGRVVTFDMVRAGKHLQTQVTLGDVQGPQQPATPLINPGMPPRGMIPYGSPGLTYRPMIPPDTSIDSVWKTFASLNVKKLNDNKYRAEAQYRDDGGKPREYAFEGTLEEIHRGIDAAQDLKPPERAQLHRLLELHGMGNGVFTPSYRALPGIPPAPPDRPTQQIGGKAKSI